MSWWRSQKSKVKEEGRRKEENKNIWINKIVCLYWKIEKFQYSKVWGFEYFYFLCDEIFWNRKTKKQKGCLEAIQSWKTGAQTRVKVEFSLKQGCGHDESQLGERIKKRNGLDGFGFWVGVQVEVGCLARQKYASCKCLCGGCKVASGKKD